MVNQPLILILMGLLLLPPGVCPCHLLEDHLFPESELADPESSTPEPIFTCSGESTPQLQRFLPAHDEEPCQNCLARKLTAGQYNCNLQGNLFDPGLVMWAVADLSPLTLSAPAATDLCSASQFLPADIPIWLTVRALLL